MRTLFLGALIALMPISVHAEPLALPPLTGSVVDLAEEIPDAEQKALEAELNDFRNNTKHQLVVVTIPDLKGEDLEDYSNRLFRHWKLGRANVDDGIMLLQSPGDGRPGSGKIRIEVGYGMEYILTDAETHRIISDVMIPILKQDRPREETTPEAIVQGARSLMSLAAVTPEQLAEDRQREKEANAKTMARIMDFFLAVLLIIVLFAGFFIIHRLSTYKKRKAEKERLQQEEERRVAARAERQRQEAEAARKRREEEDRQRAEAQRARQAMLDAMSPLERAQFDAEEARERLAEIQRRQASRKRLEEEERKRQEDARAAAEARRKKEQEEAKARQSHSQRSSGYSGYSDYGSSSRSTQSDDWGRNDSWGSGSSDSYSGGGGDSGGGGSSDSY